MIHFILTQAQKDLLLAAKALVQSELDKRHIDIMPVQLIDGTFILPIQVLGVVPELAGILNNLPSREVLQSELPAPPFP